MKHSVLESPRIRLIQQNPEHPEDSRDAHPEAVRNEPLSKPDVPRRWSTRRNAPHLAAGASLYALLLSLRCSTPGIIPAAVLPRLCVFPGKEVRLSSGDETTRTLVLRMGK